MGLFPLSFGMEGVYPVAYLQLTYVARLLSDRMRSGVAQTELSSSDLLQPSTRAKLVV